MTKLDEAKRKSIDERLAKFNEIDKKFEGKQYISQQCRLCGWSSNGLTIEEAINENRKHEATHPEYADMEANLLSISEIRDSLHDHECEKDIFNLGYCVCKCGCKAGPFCTLVLGPLCSVCQVREIRGDPGHGIPNEES